MDIKTRLAQSQEKMDELKVKIAGATEKAKDAHQRKKEEIEADIAALDAEIDAFDTAVDAQIESDITDFNAAAELVDEEIDKAIDDDIATVKGNIAAAKENARLAKERRQSKLTSARLRAQMNANAAKARIEDRKDAHDMNRQEKRIASLLDYADSCQEVALAAAMDAELTILEAAAETADYLEKYGDRI